MAMFALMYKQCMLVLIALITDFHKIIYYCLQIFETFKVIFEKHGKLGHIIFFFVFSCRINLTNPDWCFWKPEATLELQSIFMFLLLKVKETHTQT